MLASLNPRLIALLIVLVLAALVLLSIIVATHAGVIVHHPLTDSPDVISRH
jgi:hypothetical protein